MKLLLSVVLSFFTFLASSAQTYTLDRYLTTAQTNSPLLKDLRNQVLSYQVDSVRLRAGYKPQVNLNSNGYVAPNISGYGYSGAITNVQTFSALFGVNQAIVSKNYLNAQLASITLQAQSTGNSYKISEQDLKKTITTQYITAYGSLKQYKFAQEVVELLTKEEELLKKLTRSNVYRQSDYLTFLVTLKQQQLQLFQSRQQYKNDYATLNYLSGIADTSMVELQEPAIEQQLMADVTTSIFFRQYKIDSLKNVNNRQLVDFSYKPKVNLLADGGYNSDFTGQAYKNFGVSAGFSFTMPIYDGGQRKMQYRKILLEEETRQNYRAFFSTQYQQQIAQLKQQVGESDNLLTQVDEQLKYSESLIKVDTQLLQSGDVHIADLIIAVNNYLTIKNLRTTTSINKLQLINQLNYWNK